MPEVFVIDKAILILVAGNKDKSMDMKWKNQIVKMKALYLKLALILKVREETKQGKSITE